MSALGARAARTGSLIAAGVFAAPLASLAGLSTTPWLLLALCALLGAMAVVRPVAGVTALGLCVPLSFALAGLAGSSLSAVRVAEAAMFAFAGGASVRLAIDPAGARASRLGPPALALAVIVAASGVYAAFQQFGDVRLTLSRSWAQLTGSYFANGGEVRSLAMTLRWMALAAVAAHIEIALRHRPESLRVVTLVWLSASGAAALQSSLRLIEIALGRGQGVDGMVDLLVTTRFSPVYPDLNAAGSLFALLAVAAIVLGASSRPRRLPWLLAPVFGLALAATQSRAAVAALLVVLAALTAAALWRSGQRRAGWIAVFGMLLAVLALIVLPRPTHVGAEAAIGSRVELAKIALKITASAPVLGVGLGRFHSSSRDYLTPGFIESFPEAATGENAHNQFLQVLAELGVVGVVAFVWMLGAGLVARGQTSPVRAAGTRRALVAGLAAFLLSAMFGHPLLVIEIAMALFIALGLAAAGAPPRTAPSRVLLPAILAVVVVTLPWRVAEALSPPPPEFEGVSAEPGLLDGVAYRVAEPVSRWRVRARSRAAVATLRWTEGTAAGACRVRLFVDGVAVDEVVPRADVWMPVRFAIPPGRRPSQPPLVELRVSDPKCRLLVGEVRGMR